ncbi:MAG: hypothetical protein U5L11_04245 [Arhodomonas sp.]|uniref:hypothetical protein n=1 Tax=Arhodomonas sp. SL1 TaxID=3425691 RepID=UPI002AD9A7F8|nr:hypothetical protein [Arhodomonas sp.]
MSDPRKTGAWEEGPATLDEAVDYARFIRTRLEKALEEGQREDIEEALRLLDVLSGYLELRQHQSE